MLPLFMLFTSTVQRTDFCVLCQTPTEAHVKASTTEARVSYNIRIKSNKPSTTPLSTPRREEGVYGVWFTCVGLKRDFVFECFAARRRWYSQKICHILWVQQSNKRGIRRMLFRAPPDLKTKEHQHCVPYLTPGNRIAAYHPSASCRGKHFARSK